MTFATVLVFFWEAGGANESSERVQRVLKYLERNLYRLPRNMCVWGRGGESTDEKEKENIKLKLGF